MNRHVLAAVFVVFAIPLMLLLSCGTETAASLPSVCTTTTDGVALTEIAAPSGVGAGAYASEGPGPRRILLAQSTDGVNFTRLGKVLSDQANTPNMLILSSGRILVYYTAYDIDPGAASSDGANQDGIAVAVSDDKGSSWRYYCVGMTGFSSGHPPIGDPDVVQLADGTYRMFVTNGTSDNKINIFSATSTDGMSFVKEGTALNTSSQNYKDSLTAQIGSSWVMYVLNSTNGYMLRATSTNGTSFTMGSDAAYNITVNSVAKPFVLSNWYKISASSYRVFAFSMETKDIRSFTTSDGLTLTPDATVSLGTPLDSATEKSWVKDAAVQKQADGTYLMAYVAEIP